jgi:WD40 repeat protein
MIAPTSVVSVSLKPGTYITDGIQIPSSNLLAFATSNDIIKLYNTATGSFIRDVRDHNGQITDLATFGDQNASVLISSQRDTGILITDLRDPNSKPRYLTELQNSGLECFGISVSPSGNQFALSAGTDIHILDPRMNFKSLRHIPEMHTDVITKLRFVTEGVIVTGGEDMMLNVIDVQAKKEDDLLVSSISWGEAPNKLSVINNRFITATGTMEGTVVQPIPTNCPLDRIAQDGDWPLELNIPRPPLGSYVVDFVALNFGGDANNNNNGGDLELGALVGTRPGAVDLTLGAQDAGANSFYNRDERTGAIIFPGDIGDDNNNDDKPQPLSILRVTSNGVQPNQRLDFVPTHKDDVRCVLPLSGGRIVTAGEDGIICYWDLNRAGQAPPLQTGQLRRPQRAGTAGNNNHNNDDEDNNNDNDDDGQMMDGEGSSSASSGGKERRQRGTKARLANQQQQQQRN